jgi:hypothetical protein
MKKKAKLKVKSEKKSFLWWALRIGFVLMICYYFYPFLNLEIIPLWIFGYIGLFLFLFNLTVSIVSLFKLKRKSFAIISLVLTLFYVFLLLLGYLSSINLN